MFVAQDRTWKLASAVGAADSAAGGIALNNGALGQPIQVQTSGVIELGLNAAPASGIQYWVSNTPGAIAPDADITSGQYKTGLGIGVGNNQLRLAINPSGAAI